MNAMVCEGSWVELRRVETNHILDLGASVRNLHHSSSRSIKLRADHSFHAKWYGDLNLVCLHVYLGY